MARAISASTSVENLRKEAKRWLNAIRRGDVDARARFERACRAARAPVLRDVQHALAVEYGMENWTALTRAARAHRADAAASAPLCNAEAYSRLAGDLAAAHNERDQAALDRLNAHYGRSFSFDDVAAMIWRRVYAYRQRSSRVSKNDLKESEAKLLVAQDAGFGSWSALLHAAATGQPRVAAFGIDAAENRITPRRVLNDTEWRRLIDVMRTRRITALTCPMITDQILEEIATLDHVTDLVLGGSRELSDAGMRHLARMPQLEHLNLSEYPGGNLTDRGLEVLRHLPNLRTFEMTWQRGITDVGIANLQHCDRLERVNLMGTLTGDGAVAALQGKSRLRSFSTGRLVTDQGLRLLRNFPAFATRVDEGETKLLIDGPFTDRGLATLAALDGVSNLDLFWHVTAITADGFAHLQGLRNLNTLGADGELSGDAAMRHIAAIPRLENLRAQGSVATDAGFEALSRSQTLQSFWGRECPHFGTRGFLALSEMPALRRFGVSCKHVTDDALAALPQFPSLREITPIDFTDDGFRHVARCDRLEGLQCMYCRTTGDRATEHIARLRLRTYYAGLTQITDRSLEILGGMPSLETFELFECVNVTDAGLRFLARLPALREVSTSGCPGITLAGTEAFPPRVRVIYGN